MADGQKRCNKDQGRGDQAIKDPAGLRCVLVVEGDLSRRVPHGGIAEKRVGNSIGIDIYTTYPPITPVHLPTTQHFKTFDVD